jgi:hypothetical protein
MADIGQNLEARDAPRRPITTAIRKQATIRQKCRDPKCGGALPVPAEFRHAFCSRGCYDRFHRTRCRVCSEPSQNGRLHAKKCKYAHRQNPELYAYQRLQKPSDGGLCQKRARDERNPYKTGIKTRGRTWGPTLSDDSFCLASLPMHPIDVARVRRANDPERIQRETSWIRPPVLFGPDTLPLNLIGGWRFPRAETCKAEGTP